jgi:hypothetical protein
MGLSPLRSICEDYILFPTNSQMSFIGGEIKNALTPIFCHIPRERVEFVKNTGEPSALSADPARPTLPPRAGWR